MKTVNELEQRLSEPSARLVRDLAKLDGNFLILGVGGKMGPSLAKLLRRGWRQPANRQKSRGCPDSRRGI